MARLDLPPEEIFEPLADMMNITQERMGFVPNSQKTMAWKPELFKAAAALGAIAMGPGLVDQQLKFLMALLVSKSAGCLYCQAHTGNMAAAAGVEPEKEDALWDYENSPLFSDRERAALTIAQCSGQVPNAVTDEDFDELKKHFSSEEIVELMGALCYMAWLNRWNDTLGTELEELPLEHAERQLSKHGWNVGKHGSK